MMVVVVTGPSSSRTGPSDVGGPAKVYISRLGRLAESLLGGRFRSAADLWRFEERLLVLERDIQAEIKTYKSKRPKDASVHNELRALRFVRSQARRLGDTFAWILFGLDMNVIQSLSTGEKVPISQETHGTRGMMLVAAHLAGKGLGFPVIHDITDCLRTGDITFVKFVGDSRVVRTIEVKTRVVDVAPAVDGKRSVTYQITAVFASSDRVPEIDDELLQEPVTIPINRKIDSHVEINSSRIDRQLRRMKTALDQQRSPTGSVVEIDGKPSIFAELKPGDFSHWELLRRVIRRARRNGYAWESPERGWMYLVICGDDDEAVKRAMEEAGVASAIAGPEMVLAGGPGNNALNIYGIPVEAGRGPQLYLPYFLYPIPRKWRIGLAGGELAIIVIVNSGVVAEALRAAGFEVAFSDGMKLASIEATTEVTSRDGILHSVQLVGIANHVNNAVYEMRGTRHVVQAVCAMRDASLIAVEGRLQNIRSDTVEG